jgi:hypothetical protein
MIIYAYAVCPECVNQYRAIHTVPANSTLTIQNGTGSLPNWEFGDDPENVCPREWEWEHITYSQACLNTAGSGSCPYDINDVGNAGLTVSCVYYSQTSCIEIGGACGTCSVGTIINANWVNTYTCAPVNHTCYIGSTVTLN